MQNTAKNNANPYRVSEMVRGTIDISPPTPKLMDSLRQSGYNYRSGLAELIDNSIDAEATRIQLVFYDADNKTDKKTRKVEKVAVIDNGTGMTYDELKNAHKLGADRKYDKGDIGKFGLGGTIGTINLCRHRLTMTRKQGAKEIIGRYSDLDEMNERGYIHDVALTQEEISADDLKIFKRYVKNGMSGTVILLTKIDKFSSTKADTIAKSLNSYIGKHYFNYIMKRTCAFYLNEEEEQINYIHPILLNEPGVETVLDTTIEHKGHTFGIQVVNLKDHHGGSAKSLVANQGGYLVRGERLICSAFTNDSDKCVSDFWKAHAGYRHCRFLVTAPAAADDCLNTSFSKNDFAWEQGLNDKIAHEVVIHAKAMHSAAATATPVDRDTQNTNVLKKVATKLNYGKGPKWSIIYDNLGAQGVLADHAGTTIKINVDHCFIRDALAKKSKSDDGKVLLLSVIVAMEKSFAKLGESDESNVEELKRKLHSKIGDNLAMFI
jgi:hypothetical protein